MFVLEFHFWPKSVLEEDQAEKHVLNLLSYCMGFTNTTFFSLQVFFHSTHAKFLLGCREAEDRQGQCYLKAV